MGYFELFFQGVGSGDVLLCFYLYQEQSNCFFT